MIDKKKDPALEERIRITIEKAKQRINAPGGMASFKKALQNSAKEADRYIIDSYIDPEILKQQMMY